MKNVEQLVSLIFTKHVQDNKSYDYDYQSLDILRACVAKVEFQKNNPQNTWWSDRDFQSFYDSEKSLADLLKSGYIGFAVRTGGKTGGNCWGGESSYEAESDVNLDNDYLDKVLEIISPEVTYLTYRKIEKSIIQTMEYTKHEYYGNNDVYQVQLIPVKELVLMLEEKNILVSQEEIDKQILEFSQDLPKIKNKM